jgi:DNA-binding GntR family transcriptional regulator
VGKRDIVAGSSSNITQAEQAYRKLRDLIIRCELAPGSRLTQDQLARLVGLGKTPVREALQRLDHERLVTSISHHGYQVTPIMLKDVQGVYGLRLILEPAATEMAVGTIDKDDLAELRSIATHPFIKGDPESRETRLANYHRFHRIMARAPGNDYLAAAIERALDESARLVRLALLLHERDAEDSHYFRSWVEAIEAADADSARTVCAESIAHERRYVVDGLVSSPSVMSAEVVVPAVRPGTQAATEADAAITG